MSYSGGDIAQTYALLQRMYELMQQIENQGKTTERQVKKNIDNMKELNRVALQYLVLAQRLGLPPEIDRTLQNISTLILAFNQLERTIVLAQAALAGAGPVGWLALGASAAFTTLSFYSLGNQ